MKTTAKIVVFFLVLYLVVIPQRAEAYLDPGTGSYVLQVLAAALFGGLFLVKTWWKQIKHYVSALLYRKEAKSSEKHTSKEK